MKKNLITKKYTVAGIKQKMGKFFTVRFKWLILIRIYWKYFVLKIILEFFFQ